MSDQWMERLSEYVDDELSEGERVALEAHLESCIDCSVVLADLRAVVERARHLDPYRPRQDLWPEIAQRIGATSSRPRPIRRWSFSFPQLAAAAAVLMTLSGGTVWLMQEQRSIPLPVPGSITTAPTSIATPAAVTASRNAAQSYASAVADLEQVLAGGRGQLDSTTVRVIEQNLAV